MYTAMITNMSIIMTTITNMSIITHMNTTTIMNMSITTHMNMTIIMIIAAMIITIIMRMRCLPAGDGRP